ncbi:MAG: hypothetical protein PVJ53_13505 [Desulfobacterales bacterium]
MAPGQISTTDKRALNHAHRRHFDAFNARHHNRWKANINKKDGKVRVLFGNRSKSYAGGAEIAARGFLKEARDLFRMREDLEDLKTSRIDKSFRRHHVRFQQTYDGVPVKGAYTIVHANEAGQVSMVQNDYRDDLQVDNVRLVAREDAARIALNDLYPDLDEETIVFDARAEEMIVPHRGGHRFVWKVTIPTQRPYALWVYHVDAQHYTILYKANEILSLRKGKGRVYKSNKDWFKRRTRIQSLPNMFTAADGFQSGWLYGRHADIYDDNGNDPFAPNYRFIYDPNLPSEKPWFDATTAYYSLNSIRGWWQSKVLKKYGPANPDYYFTLSIPTIVNVLDYCNAFYTPDLGAGYPGFVFGNEESCYPGSEDLVLDQSIVSHEFTHAMMDWCGFDSQFGGALHNYGRAMGEGNADWFAYLYTKSTKIGAVLYDDTLDGYLRNINNTMIYPDDVDDPYFGVPQEHYTGQIWGGYLYDLNRHLKSKALKFIYQGLFYFTAQGGHRPNRADFYDAIHAQILAEQDLTNGKYKNAAKAWGCMASRGINGVLRPVYSHPSNYFGTGSPGSDQTAYFAWSFPEVKRIKTKGCVLKPSDTNEFPIIISEAERDLKISVKAAASMAPELELYTTDATHVATGTTKGKKANLTVADIPAGEYVIVLSANQGCYSININVK